MSLGFALWGRPPGLRGSSRTRVGRRGRRPQDWSPAPRSLPKESKLSDIAHDCVRHIITARRANEDHCDSGAVLPGPSCHPHHIRAIDSLSASRRHGPAGTFHRRRLQNTRGSEALAAELLATGVGCRGAGGGPGHFVLAGSEAAQPESAGRAGHWFGGLFRRVPRRLRLHDLGALQELVLLKPVQVPRRLDRALVMLKYFYLGLALFFALKPAAARDFVICRFDPFVGFFRRSGAPHMLLIGGAFLVAGMFIGRPYCRYLCPYGGLLAWCTRLARRGVTITPDKELDCGLCAEACPYGAI